MWRDSEGEGYEPAGGTPTLHGTSWIQRTVRLSVSSYTFTL